MILSFFAGLISLAWISWQDWQTEKFNALIPLLAILIISAIQLNSGGSAYGVGYPLNVVFMGILIWKEYMRPGDMLPLLVYTGIFNSFQSFFTLLMVTGIYLYAYPKIAKEKDWVAFAPAILISYIVQAIFYLV